MIKALKKFSVLNFVERVGNALPHPATLFALFAFSVLVLSMLAHWVGWTAIHPVSKEIVEPVNLLSKEGFHRVLLEMVENFTGFAPLGIVIVAWWGIGWAAYSIGGCYIFIYWPASSNRDGRRFCRSVRRF